MIRLPARAPDLNFLNQKNYFESKRLFLISPSNQFRLPREEIKTLFRTRGIRYAHNTMNPEKLFRIEIVPQHPGPAELAEILPFKVRLRFIPTVLAQSATSYPDCPGRVWDVADSPG